MAFRISLLEAPESRASRIISFARFSSTWCEANIRSALPKHAGRRSFHVFWFLVPGSWFLVPGSALAYP